jgi:hypothetical protein
MLVGIAILILVVVVLIFLAGPRIFNTNTNQRSLLDAPAIVA